MIDLFEGEPGEKRRNNSHRKTRKKRKFQTSHKQSSICMATKIELVRLHDVYCVRRKKVCSFCAAKYRDEIN